jgi:hypothetical protein
MTTETTHDTVHRFDALNYVATEPEARDREQSQRLHEPEWMITTIDPISGRDILDMSGRPHIVDGNILIYFETEENRQAYLDTPIDHPVKLPDNPYEDWVAEG